MDCNVSYAGVVERPVFLLHWLSFQTVKHFPAVNHSVNASTANALMNHYTSLVTNSAHHVSTTTLSILAHIFPGGPGLADTRMSPFSILLEPRMNGGDGDSWSYKMCKAPVKSSPTANQHPVFLQAGCLSCRPTNSVRALKDYVLVLQLQNINSFRLTTPPFKLVRSNVKLEWHSVELIPPTRSEKLVNKKCQIKHTQCCELYLDPPNLNLNPTLK